MDAELQADKMFLYSNNTIKLESGSVLRSTVDNECDTSAVQNTDLYQCMSTEFDDTTFYTKYLLDNFNQQYGITPGMGG